MIEFLVFLLAVGCHAKIKQQQIIPVMIYMWVIGVYVICVLFVRIQNLVTVFVILCESCNVTITTKEFECHRKDVTKMKLCVCRHYYFLNNHLVPILQHVLWKTDPGLRFPIHTILHPAVSPRTGLLQDEQPGIMSLHFALLLLPTCSLMGLEAHDMATGTQPLEVFQNEIILAC